MKVPRGARLGAAAPAIVEARLKPTGDRAVDDSDYRLAMAKVAATGMVPAGWEVSGVRWGRFTVRGEETDAFRFTRWQAGQAVDLAAFPAGLFAGAVVGIERLEGRAREVTRTERRTVTVKERTGRYHHKRKGKWVSAAYAKRYRHLVTAEVVTRRVRRTVKVREKVPMEEAVIRFTYEAGFSVSDVPGVAE